MDENKNTQHANLVLRTGMMVGKATIYGTKWCGHTKNQIDTFNKAKIPFDFIDCDKNPQQCQGISAYPTIKDWPAVGDNHIGFLEGG